MIADWRSKTHISHNIAKKREKKKKQANSLHDVLINFARGQEMEKIFPTKMQRRREAAFIC